MRVASRRHVSVYCTGFEGDAAAQPSAPKATDLEATSARIREPVKAMVVKPSLRRHRANEFDLRTRLRLLTRWGERRKTVRLFCTVGTS
jgi:hypothetical protein